MDLLHSKGGTRGVTVMVACESEKMTSVKDIKIKYKWDPSRGKCGVSYSLPSLDEVAVSQTPSPESNPKF